MDGVGSTFGLITQIVNIKMKILFLLCIGNFFSGSVFGQLKIVTVPSLEGYSHGDINLPCSASLNRNDIKLMWITWIQNTQKVYEYDGYNAKHIVELPGYNVDLKQVQQGDIALTISRNTLTPGVYTFKCEVTEGSFEGRGETTLTIRANNNTKKDINAVLLLKTLAGSIFGQLKVVTVPSLEGYSDGDINLPCNASLNRKNIKLMRITWIQNAVKVYEYDGSTATHIVKIPGYNVDLKQVQQGDVALTIARNILTPGVYTFKCEVREGSSEDRGETTLTVKAPPQILTVNAARSVTVKELPYDLTCSVPNLRWNKVEKMTLTWKENGKDLCFFDGSNSDAQQSKKCHCVECYPSLCLLTLRDAHISDVNYTCIVTEGNAEGNAAIEVKFKAPPQILTVNAARSVTVKELPYDLTCSVPNLRWNKVEKMTLTWKENGKDLCFFDGSNSDAQQSKKCHCVKSYPSLCLLSLTDAHISDVNYTCIVTEGNAEGSATIAVKFKD